MNKLFVAYKPSGLSSNAFLNQLKKKYNNKKAGFSGTLDPFAKGVLLIAFGQYTKLFRFFKKSPKIYKATLWFGVKSKSLDNQNIENITSLPPFDFSILQKIQEELLGIISYTPPAYCAKKINGVRSYELAKRGLETNLKTCKMEIFYSKILHYHHPFLTMEISVSEGGYIRSYCELFAKKLGIDATLSSLERLCEGNFYYENEKELNILDYLNLKKNTIKYPQKLHNGQKIFLDDLEIQKEGCYLLEEDDFFSIINIENNQVQYYLNKVLKC
ncbi:tRNA pseudouridine(55) synthase TruB [Campylobacter insulaenigrae]|uniref:tRNA pseudouridine(55) synthase n=1 Tax=Campylobacter insulaenigrae TaxID=260714 RepID=A0ABY3G4P8_9BACT|nr:tRNA pseudouridine(55) synthase TruB [Campylobacter insulaenigrae]TWO24639.1 tRNA pseudouridine(55) synthase TruB [Campylobacter insulaenigrae]